ncbi:MAG TPA: YdeI/OmpD-associated family protein [Candidatus Limnocylindrales bacterium]
MEPHDVRFFATPEELRDWFSDNHETADELWLGYYKKASGRPSVDWTQVVDEALCVGWIDGVRKRVDDEVSVQRLTPRRKGSTWSAINVAKVARLTAEGRMRPAGLAAFAVRTDGKTAIYSYEQPPGTLSDDELSRFRTDHAAWADWEGRPPSYRRAATHWITSAKQDATRRRRLATLIEDSRAGRPLKHLSWNRKTV